MPEPYLTALATAVLHVPERPERILAIGCGEGEGALFLAREFPAARVRGVDASAEAIGKAVARVGLDPEGRVAYKRGRPSSLPYPEGFFDLVVHLSGRLHAAEIARVLRPGGRLVLIGSPRWADWRLGQRGFEPVESGAADGCAFRIVWLRDSD